MKVNSVHAHQELFKLVFFDLDEIGKQLFKEEIRLVRILNNYDSSFVH
jgi:hypothetical protein